MPQDVLKYIVMTQEYDFEISKNGSGIKHILICKQGNYIYYSVDIRKDKKRYRKRFSCNIEGLKKAINYVNEIKK